MNLTDTYVIRNDTGEITDYVFIDPTSRSWKPKPERHAFDLAVSFAVDSKIDKNYPVVFDDMVTMHGERLLPIEYATVPPAVKRRLVAWLKVQPGHAAGPAGEPTVKSKGSGAKASKTGSDDVKEALVRLHPDTRAADWKRRSRNKEADGIHRLFEHVDGRTVMTVELPDGTISIPDDGPVEAAAVATDSPEGVRNRTSVQHEAIEIFISGPQVDALRNRFEDFDDNPEAVALFRPKEVSHDADGEYQGDGCDRLELEKGLLWAAMDGLSGDAVDRITDEVQAVARRHPGLKYLVVGMRRVEDDDEVYDILFCRGFDAVHDNPMRLVHGRFYVDYTVNGAWS